MSKLVRFYPEQMVKDKLVEVPDQEDLEVKAWSEETIDHAKIRFHG